MVLVSEVLNFTAKNMPEYSDYLLFQSMLKVLYFSKLNLNFIMMRWQKFRFSAIIETKQLLANLLKQWQYTPFQFLSNLLCFTMLIYSRQYKPSRNINSPLMIIILNGVQEDHGLIKQLFKNHMDPYLRNYLSLHSKTYIR